MSEMRKRWHGAPKGARFVGMIAAGLIAVVFFGFFCGYFVMLLWNWLMPYLFNLKQITYWQAFGVVMLAHLIFGSHRIGSHGPGSERRARMRRNHMYENEDNNRDWRSWRYYDEWWDKEGKRAYDNYVDKRKEEGASEDSKAL